MYGSLEIESDEERLIEVERRHLRKRQREEEDVDDDLEVCIDSMSGSDIVFSSDSTMESELEEEIQNGRDKKVPVCMKHDVYCGILSVALPNGALTEWLQHDE